MKSHIAVAVISVLCLSLFSGYSAPAEQKITVISPMGTPPPIKLIPMAPRLTTLEGKTIYVVDQGFPGSENLIREWEANVWGTVMNFPQSGVLQSVPISGLTNPRVNDLAGKRVALMSEKQESLHPFAW